MVDIHSVTAEIRQGKKKRRKKKKPQGKNIMSASAMQGGHNEAVKLTYFFILSVLVSSFHKI